jgi:glucosylglycerate phosphorylase
MKTGGAMMVHNEVMLNDKKLKIYEKLEFLYGKERAGICTVEIMKMLEAYITGDIKGEQGVSPVHKDETGINESTIVLIAYGDQITDENKAPLKCLEEFLNRHLKGITSHVHILPFYPYTSDDGFSVVDYQQVDPELGDWSNIRDISSNYKLMFDGVINHISAKSDWFQKYIKGDTEFSEFFIEVDEGIDLSGVTRPRTLPLLTRFDTHAGEKYVWTTFSEDQIDLNYKNEKVLLKIIETLLFYISKGASMIRLDAIGYLWKSIGTSCIHLEETHLVVKLFRDILDIVAPDVVIITETNVPHKDNISYFGKGNDEAQMVYQFPLAPLVLHTFHTGNAVKLLKWADTLENISDKTAFFNFLASHDGIGVMPAKGILSDEEIDGLVRLVKDRDGHVSYKTEIDGSQKPYELNITYFDAICNSDEEQEIQLKKFISAQSILLSMMGVPGIYIHSLLGSGNYTEGVSETGRYRTINREKFKNSGLEKELNNPESSRSKVFKLFKDLIDKRIKEKAFHPNAQQKALYFNEAVFSLLRTSMDDMEKILVLNNVSGIKQELCIDLKELDIPAGEKLLDIISGKRYAADKSKIGLILDPYQVLWLKTENHG